MCVSAYIEPLIKGCKNLGIGILDRVPLWGTGFFFAGKKAHVMALYEFSFCVVLSTIPLWLGSILIMGIDPNVANNMQGFSQTFLELIKGGDLFLYCTSIFTAIAWLNIKHSLNVDGQNKSIAQRNDTQELREALNLRGQLPGYYRSVYPPNKFLFLFISFVGFIVCVAFYALNLAKIAVEPDYARQVSSFVFIISLVLYHNILVSDHAGFESFEKKTSEETNKFMDDYAAHRKGEK